MFCFKNIFRNRKPKTVDGVSQIRFASAIIEDALNHATRECLKVGDTFEYLVEYTSSDIRLSDISSLAFMTYAPRECGIQILAIGENSIHFIKT